MDSSLWARCKAGDTESRGALIEGYADLAARIARGMYLPTGALTGREDLESAALVGLIDAVDRFQPDRGVPFEAYAALRIRGAILDELRRVDQRGRTADAPAQSLSLDKLLAAGRALIPAPDELNERHEDDDLRMRVETALRALPPRQRELLSRYYGDALTLREAGKRMGISEARACQLHGRAIYNLRRSLSAPLAVAAA